MGYWPVADVERMYALLAHIKATARPSATFALCGIPTGEEKSPPQWLSKKDDIIGVEGFRYV